MSLKLTFYGDDFTGSSAVMEVLNFAGVPTMLFMDPPTPETLKRYPNLQAIGVAGVARSKDPAWMRTNLPPIYQALKKLKAPICHYKTCSTFDSSPKIGSIGTATELGKDSFNPDWIPLVVGAPEISRYQAFGNLFAGTGTETGAGAITHRLDRHPVMARHPATPMDEADLARHLSKQTSLQTNVLDLAVIKSGQSEATLQHHVNTGADIIAIDVIDDETLQEAGRLIWRDGTEQTFAVGSQGIQYALVAHWRKTGLIPAQHAPPTLKAVDQIFAVSGSCAPTTADQITHAEQHGFKILSFNAATATDPNQLQKEATRIRTQALALLAQNHDVIVTTARGPNDPALPKMANAIKTTNADPGLTHERLGQALGQLVADVRRQTALQRIIIAGGDTSGHALTMLNAEALSAIAPLAPGAPLCKIHTSNDPQIDGLEITLKGGQMGDPTFFTKAKGIPT